MSSGRLSLYVPQPSQACPVVHPHHVGDIGEGVRGGARLGSACGDPGGHVRLLCGGVLFLQVEQVPDAMYRPMFRFSKAEFPILMAMYDIPERVVCEDRSVWSGHAALAVFLRRLSFPTRYIDLVMFFRRSKTALCGAFKFVLDRVYRASADRMQRLSREQLDDAKLREFAEAIRAKGFPMSNCFGLVDGTIFAVCRPTGKPIFQRSLYTKYKKLHGLKWQMVQLPNGIMVVTGPYSAR